MVKFPVALYVTQHELQSGSQARKASPDENSSSKKSKTKNQKMKTQFKYPKPIYVILALIGFTLSAQAVPTLIVGALSISGTATMDGTSFVSATKFTLFQDVVVGAASSLSGAYVGTQGAAVTLTPFTWAPPTASTPINPLWSFISGGDTYSFDLSTLHVDFTSNTGILMSGLGTAIITGPGTSFLNTTGEWDFSAQTEGLSTFTFSSTTTVPAPAVPDGGSTVSMLGAALCGLGWIGRKQFRAKNG